jgi:hypothetical protein
MRLDGYAETRLEDGRILRTENEGLAVWTGYSHQGEDGNLAWFDFRNGNVVVKNPDSEILQKMWSLAQLSEVLRGKKGLSMAMVQRLRARFHVSARIES